jgi:LETM1 and EF-hand domain-containing protein 1
MMHVCAVHLIIVLSRTARSHASALGPASLAAANSLLFNGRGIQAQVSALAILLPQRGYATEHNTSTSSPQSYPPPGFNADQAKNPIPQEQAETVKPVAASQSEVTKVPARDVPTKTVAAENSKNVAEEKKETKKLTIGQKIKKEVQHYWDGTKLLATEVKISSRLALKMAGGYELSRREHRQVCDHCLD